MNMNSGISSYKYCSGHRNFEFRGLSSFLHRQINYRTYLTEVVLMLFSGLVLKVYPVNVPDPGSICWRPTEFGLVIQVGAFRKEVNATVFREKLSAIIDKPVIIVNEEEYYKVQLIGFKNMEDIEKIIPALGLIGIKDFWIPPVKKDTAVPDYADLQTDTIQKPPDEKVVNPLIPGVTDSLVFEETPAVTTNTYALEIGAFRKKNRALNAQSKVISKLNLPVEIATQWNRYHVIITGFNDKTEMTRYIPELARLGYDEISVIKNYGTQP